MINIDNLKTWPPPYGGYDCFLNSVTYLLDNLNINPKELYLYNWNFFYTSRHNIYGGSIPSTEVLSFLKNHYTLKIEKKAFEEINDQEIHIIGFDAFDLEYIKDAYQKQHQLHYVLAHKNGHYDYLDIYDPYYRTHHVFDKQLAYNSYRKYNVNILSITKEDLLNPCNNLNVVRPFLLNHQDKSNYLYVKSHLLKTLHAIVNMDKSANTKKFIANIQTLILNRRAHFQKGESPLNDYYPVINNSWNELLRYVVRISIGKPSFKDSYSELIENIIFHELSYLEAWSNFK